MVLDEESSNSNRELRRMCISDYHTFPVSDKSVALFIAVARPQILSGYPELAFHEIGYVENIVTSCIAIIAPIPVVCCLVLGDLLFTIIVSVLKAVSI
jgi:hypothetical protein